MPGISSGSLPELTSPKVSTVELMTIERGGMERTTAKYTVYSFIVRPPPAWDRNAVNRRAMRLATLVILFMLRKTVIG
jgi:hypothetical protein